MSVFQHWRSLSASLRVGYCSISVATTSFGLVSDGHSSGVVVRMSCKVQGMPLYVILLFIHALVHNRAKVVRFGCGCSYLSTNMSCVCVCVCVSCVHKLDTCRVRVTLLDSAVA